MIVALVVCFTSPVIAADNLRNLSTAQGHSYGVAVGDASSGAALEVDTNGSAYVQPYGAHTIGTNSNYAGSVHDVDDQIVTGASLVYSITVTGIATGDWVEIYDGTSRTGIPEFDIKCGTANSTQIVSLPAGASFADGVFAHMIDQEVLVSVEYDQ